MAQVGLEGFLWALILSSIISHLFHLLECVVVALCCRAHLVLRLSNFLAHQARVHLELVALLRVTRHRFVVVAVFGVLLDLRFSYRCWNVTKNVRSHNLWNIFAFTLTGSQGLELLLLHFVEDLEVVDFLVYAAVWVLEDQLLLVLLVLGAFIIIRDALGRILQINVIHLVL